MEQNYNVRQLLSLGAVIALVPALRLYPAEAAAVAGRAAWLCPLAALPLLLGWVWAAARFLALREKGEYLPDLLLRLGGRRLGKPALALFALWTLIYAGFVLRSGADRLVGTVYPAASPALFCQAMGLLGLAAALSSPRTLVRLGRMLLPLLLGVLLALIGAALLSADIGKLWPLTPEELARSARAALVPLDILAGSGTALCFLAGGLSDEAGLRPALAKWMLLGTALLTLLGAAVTGAFGAELTARLARPLFVLVRTLVFFHTVERVEALVVMLWIFPDFLMLALFLWTGQYSLRLLCGYRPDDHLHPRLELGEGRWLAWVLALGATALSLFLAPDSDALARWSEAVIPAMNLGMVFVFFPLMALAGGRKKPAGS